MAKYKLMTSQVVTTREHVVYEVEAENAEDAKKIFMNSIEESSENQFPHYKDEEIISTLWEESLPKYSEKKDVFLQMNDNTFSYIDTFTVLPNNDETLNN